MAWRIEETLIRGEVDNRVHGRVTGRLWFTGRDKPVVLELEGNAWRDVAGHVLRFTNPAPKPARAGEWDHFPAVQRGVVGDITASRKVKVPDCSMDEVMEFSKAKKPFPWHWGNSLYLEWHSETNGRVLIESAANCIEVAASRLNEGRGLPEDPSRRLGWLEIPKVVSTENAIRVVDIAMRLVGGGAFRRGHVLEKLYRDARSGPFHPLTTDQLMQHLGRAELG